MEQLSEKVPFRYCPECGMIWQNLPDEPHPDAGPYRQVGDEWQVLYCPINGADAETVPLYAVYENVHPPDR